MKLHGFNSELELLSNDPIFKTKLSPKFNEVKNLYIQAQIFVNYLMTCEGSGQSIKNKISLKKQLNFYLEPQNMNQYKVSLSSA